MYAICFSILLQKSVDVQKTSMYFVTCQYNIDGSLQCMHLYIIDHYNPSIRIIDLVSHAIYVVCVNRINEWRDLEFKVDSERQIFLRNFSWQFYLLIEFLPEIC